MEKLGNDFTREMIQLQYKEVERREKTIALKEERLDDVEKSIEECSKNPKNRIPRTKKTISKEKVMKR